MRMPPLDVSRGPQFIELAFAGSHYVNYVTYGLYSQSSTSAPSPSQLLDPAKLFFSLLLSVLFLQDSPEAFSFMIAARVFFCSPGSSCSCSILFAQNLELPLHLHLGLPLLPSFWIKLTLNANFSDNSGSQYTVLGKVLTANSFANPNLRRLDHPD